MIKFWSELPAARAKEQVADLATFLWVAFWGSLAWRLFRFLASFSEAGRTIRGGGETMIQSGRALGDSLAGVPLVGPQLRDIARDAFAATFELLGLRGRALKAGIAGGRGFAAAVAGAEFFLQPAILAFLGAIRQRFFLYARRGGCGRRIGTLAAVSTFAIAWRPR